MNNSLGFEDYLVFLKSPHLSLVFWQKIIKRDLLLDGDNGESTLELQE